MALELEDTIREGQENLTRNALDGLRDIIEKKAAEEEKKGNTSGLWVFLRHVSRIFLGKETDADGNRDTAPGVQGSKESPGGNEIPEKDGEIAQIVEKLQAAPGVPDLLDIGNLKNLKGDTVLMVRDWTKGKSHVSHLPFTPYCHKAAARDFARFGQAFFRETGQPLIMNNVFRSEAHQQALRDYYAGKGGKNPAAPVGESNHGTGRGGDMDFGEMEKNGSLAKVGGRAGLRKMAERYGFIPHPNTELEEHHIDHVSSRDISKDERRTESGGFSSKLA